MDAFEAFYRDSTLPVDQRRMAAVAETRRLLRETIREFKALRNAAVHDVTDPKLFRQVADEILSVEPDGDTIVLEAPAGGTGKSGYHDVLALLGDLGRPKYILVSALDCVLAPPVHLHELFYQVLRSALRRANSQFRLLLRAFERPQRLHEFVARQRSWHLLHGARPPRPLVFLLRPMILPGAPA